MAKRSAAKRSSKPPEPQPPATARRLGTVIGLLLIIVVGIVAYANSVSGIFLLDDEPAIVRNPDIRDDVPLLRSTVPPTPEPGKGRWRGPVVAFTVAMNYRIGGLKPYGYHVFNISVHILVALLVFGIVRRTLLLESMRERYGPAAGWLATATALIWLVHPLVTDSVTYIIQRSEAIMGLFYLLTLYCFIRGCRANRPRNWFVCATVACALGMVSKEVMVTAPVVVLLFDRTFVAGSFIAAFRTRGRVYVALAATWAALIWLMVSSPHPDVVGFNLDVGAAAYAKAQCQMVIHYLRLAFVPTQLVLDYGPATIVQLGDVVLPGAILLVLLGLAAICLWRNLPIGFALASIFVILAPTSSFVPIVTEVGAERRMYLPLMALVAIVVVGGYRLLFRSLRPASGESNQRTVAGWAGLVVLGVVVTGLSLLTVRRNAQYHDAETIWRDTVAKRPGNFRAHHFFGLALRQDDKFEEAIAEYDKVLELNPDYYRTHYNMGNALRAMGRDEEAIVQFRRAIEAQPDFADAHTNLGNVLLSQGRTDEAIAEYKRALKIDPQHPKARRNLAMAHTNLGNALLSQERIDDAIAEYEQALQIDPRYSKARSNLAMAHTNLGNTLLSQEQISEAIAQYQQALKIDSAQPQARKNIEIAKAKQDKVMKLVAGFEQQVRSEPDSAKHLAQLAWILATHPDESVRDSDRAVRLAQRAATLSQFLNPEILDSLAAAYASAGRFDEAVATATDAIKIADTAALYDLESLLRKRLEYYRAKKPYRGPFRIDE